MGGNTHKPTRGKLLFLAYHFPPGDSIASVRAGNITKYLAKSGWDVSVVTIDPSLLRVSKSQGVDLSQRDYGYRTVYTKHPWRFLSPGYLRSDDRHGIKRYLGAMARRVAFMVGIDSAKVWCNEVERTCAKVQPEDVDVILATGGPFETFGLAQRISLRLGKPFVLDYRDLWCHNPHLQRPLRNRQKRMEKDLLAKCTAVSVISPSMAKVLCDTYQIEDKVKVVTNGYDPEAFEAVKPHHFGHFAIVYAGAFFPPKRDVGPLIQLLARSEQLGVIRPWQFHYYGSKGDYVRESARASGIERVVVCHGHLSHWEALEAIRGAGVAVVITSVHDTGNLADRTIVTGKLFEPIGLQTPYLVMAPAQSDVEQIVETAGGGAFFRGSDVDGMVMYVAGLMKGNAPPWKNRECFSWTSIAKHMDKLLFNSIGP